MAASRGALVAKQKHEDSHLRLPFILQHAGAEARERAQDGERGVRRVHVLAAGRAMRPAPRLLRDVSQNQHEVQRGVTCSGRSNFFPAFFADPLLASASHAASR